MSAVVSCGKGSVAIHKNQNNSECPSAKGSDMASCKQVDIDFDTESKAKDSIKESVVGKGAAAEESNDTEDEAVAVKS